MRQTVYETPDGIQVMLDRDTWWRHIHGRRPHIAETELAMALKQPVRIYADTSFADRRVYLRTTTDDGIFSE